MDKPKFVVNNPDGLIGWWEVSPSRTDGDYEPFDRYQDAVECAQNLSEMLVDQMEPGEELHIVIKFVKECTRQEFYNAFGFITEDEAPEPAPDNKPASPPLDVIA
jgi:hypothetical protein